jgi:hypothetical protein
LLCLCALPAPAGEEPGPSLGKLLGPDLEGAKIVAHREGALHVIRLSTMEAREIASFPKAHPVRDLSRPWWSPDGREVLFSYRGRAFLVGEDGSNLRPVMPEERSVHEPSWWVDPRTGGRCVVFKTGNAKFKLEHRGRKEYGRTFLYRLGSGEKTELADIPMDGGLSRDGTHLGEAYGGCLVKDLVSGELHVLNNGRQACNASISPDDTYRLMYLFLPHDFIAVSNKYDLETWRLTRLEGSSEWQHPRWSNHPDFATATAKFGAEFTLALLRIDTEEVTLLGELGPGWAVPHLWLPSGAKIDRPPPGPVDDLELGRLEGYKRRFARARRYAPLVKEIEASDDPEAKEIIRAIETHVRERYFEAMRGEDFLRSRAILRELADRFEGLPVGGAARKQLERPQFRREVDAATRFGELELVEMRLRPVEGAKAHYSDEAYLRRNKVVLSKMTALVEEISREFAGTRAAARAKALARSYGLPAEAVEAGRGRLVLVATIEEASKVPSPEAIAPYTNVVTFIRYRVDEIVSGDYDAERIVVAHWGMRQAVLTPAASWRPGVRQRLAVDLFDSHEELQQFVQAREADDFELAPYWALDVRPVD